MIFSVNKQNMFSLFLVCVINILIEKYPTVPSDG